MPEVNSRYSNPMNAPIPPTTWAYTLVMNCRRVVGSAVLTGGPVVTSVMASSSVGRGLTVPVWHVVRIRGTAAQCLAVGRAIVRRGWGFPLAVRHLALPGWGVAHHGHIWRWCATPG